MEQLRSTIRGRLMSKIRNVAHVAPLRRAVWCMAAAFAVALGVWNLGAPPAVAAPPAPAICDCPMTGPFTAPQVTAPAVAKPYVSAYGTSADDAYKVVPEQGALTVASGAKTVLTIPLASTNAGWGFSPDNRHFLVNQIADGMLDVALYDLRSGQRVFHLSEPPGSAGVGFSPTGKYLLVATGSGIVVADRSGTVVYRTALTGLSAWGFSPDDDRLLLAATPDQNSETVQLYDLAAGHSAADFSVPTSSAAWTVSSAWGFSPHGLYFMDATTTQSTTGGTAHTNLVVLHATYQPKQPEGAYQTSFDTPLASWGFSSDDADRMFLVSARIPGTTKTDSATVADLVGGGSWSITNIDAPYAVWSFSPCGDRVALAQAPTQASNPRPQLDVTLFEAITGRQIVATRLTHVWTAQVERIAKADAASNLTDQLDYVSTPGDPQTRRLAPVTAQRRCGLGLTAAVQSVSLETGELNAGQATTATVQTDGTFATAVNLMSSNPAVSIPASIVVPLGGQAHFPVTTSTAIAGDTAVSITASAGQGAGATSAGTALIVLAPCGTGPASLSATANDLTLSLPSDALTAGTGETATIQLGHPAPHGGEAVQLTTSDPGVTVPSTVTVPAGQKGVTFPVSVGKGYTADAAVTVSTTAGPDTATAELLVEALRPLEEAGQVDPVYGGLSGSDWVATHLPALPCGTQVSFTSSSPVVTVPASITIPAGQTEGRFTFTTRAVDAATPVTITATAGGVSQNIPVDVLPLPRLSALSFNPSTLVGGAPAQATLTLTAPAPAAGLTADLSADSSTVTVPANVFIEPGSSQATFTVQTASVTAATYVTITATADGHNVQAGLQVQPAAVQAPPSGWFGAATVPSAAMLRGVAFIDDQHGWAVGENGTILGTSDGGQIWTAEPSGTSSNLQAVHFTSPSNGVAVGSGCGSNQTCDGVVIVATTDGGHSWHPVLTNTDYTLYGVAFSDAQHGIAVGDGCGDGIGMCGGAVLRTSDGGATWALSGSDASGPDFVSVAFADPSHVFAVGYRGLIYASADGGVTWHDDSPSLDPVEDFTSVSFGDALHGVAVGTNALVAVTADGGTTWTQIDTGSAPWWQSLSGVQMLDAARAVAVGARGTVIGSDDGGHTWAAETANTSNDLTAVALPDAGHGLAVGGQMAMRYGGEGFGQPAISTVLVEQVSPLTITTTSLPDGTVGSPYVATLTAGGSGLGSRWAIDAGTLPVGLALDPITGQISGTPTAAGDTQLTIGLHDALGRSDQEALTLHVQ